jgi:hypothetical protein
MQQCNNRCYLPVVIGVGLLVLLLPIVIQQTQSVEVTTFHYGYIYHRGHSSTDWGPKPWVRWPWANWVFQLLAPVCLLLVHCVFIRYRQPNNLSWQQLTTWQVGWLLLFAVQSGQPLDQMAAWCVLVIICSVPRQRITPLVDTSSDNKSPGTEASPYGAGVGYSGRSIGDGVPASIPSPAWSQLRFDRSSQYRCSFASLSTDIDWQQELASVPDDKFTGDTHANADPDHDPLADTCRIDLPVATTNGCPGLGCYWQLPLLLLLWVQLFGRWQHWTWVSGIGWALHSLYFVIPYSTGGDYVWSTLLLCQTGVFWWRLMIWR